MHLRLTRSIVRSWTNEDLASLVKHADNRKIWLNLRDRFPHPYAKSDGRAYIRLARTMDPETFFAIEVDGLATEDHIGPDAEGGVEVVPARLDEPVEDGLHVAVVDGAGVGESWKGIYGADVTEGGCEVRVAAVEVNR